MPKFSYGLDQVPVSTEFIEHKMPQANAAFVKVYLYALMLATRQQEAEYSLIAQKLNLLESDVVQAFQYWEQEGVLTCSGGMVLFGQTMTAVKEPVSHAVSPAASIPEPIPVFQPSSVQAAPPASKAEAPKIYDIHEMTAAIDQNASLAEMFKLAQEVVGKTLTNTDIQTLYWFYDGLDFSPEVILMLLEYCVSLDKRSMSYIEKVAIAWNERGISSMGDVEAFLHSEQEKDSYLYTLRKIFGIMDRNLSRMEENYLVTWHDKYEMSEEMIALAYEYCILQINKLSFQYMDRIISRWHQKGIHTIEGAEKDNEEFKSKQKKPASPIPSQKQYGIYQDTYNHDELEQIIRKKINQKED